METTRTERAERLLKARLDGVPLAELAEQENVTHQAISACVRRATRRHVEGVLLELWVAHKGGQGLGIQVPAWASGEDHSAAVTYLGWLVGELRALDCDVELQYRPRFDGGFDFVLRDKDFDFDRAGDHS